MQVQLHPFSPPLSTTQLPDVPVVTGLFAVLDPREVPTSYQGKAEMGWLLLFFVALAIGFCLARSEVQLTRFKALPDRRR